MKSTLAKSVQDIVRWADNIDILDNYIFRGQVNDWPLLASIFRPTRAEELGDAPPAKYDPLKHEKKIIDLFKKRAKPRLNFEPKNNLEWLAIAQHHRVPTRLLDWTFSVLVAAYFACENMGAGPIERSAVIFGLGLHGRYAIDDELDDNPYIVMDDKKNLYV